MKKLLVNIFIILSIIMLCTNVKAQTSLKLNLESDKQEIKGQDEVTITVKTTKLIDVDKVINVYKGTIEYDKLVFEEITDSNFYCQNSWSNLKYNKENQQFIVINEENNNAVEEVFKLKLNVKENINVKETLIKIKDITTSYGEYDISVETQGINLKIVNNKEEQKPNEPDKSEDDNEISEESKNNNTNIPKDEQVTEDFNTVDKEQIEVKVEEVNKGKYENIADKILPFTGQKSRDNFYCSCNYFNYCNYKFY